MSSASSDENSELLREALDAQFINDAMFNNYKKSDKPLENTTNPSKASLKNLRSLRSNIDQNEQFHNTLGVTPQFQQYVAKKLSLLLEKKLEKRLSNNINNYVHQKRKKSGVKLFSNSTKYIKMKTNNRNERKRAKTNKSDSDNDTKCIAAAVQPEDILNKNDTKHWSAKSKAPIFRYKKTKNGTLTSLD